MVNEFRELNVLESKVAEVASLCRTLRTENLELRQQLALAESERRRLAERMDAARQRLEALADQLPNNAPAP